MANNITNIHNVKCELFVEGLKLRKFFRKNRVKFPENCFINDLYETVIDSEETSEESLYYFPIKSVYWSDEFSGRNFDVLIDFLNKTTGYAELVVLWENGELTGLKVCDGLVAECDVSYKLVEKNCADCQ